MYGTSVKRRREKPENLKIPFSGQFRHGMAHGDVKILYMVPQVIPVSRDPTTTMQSTTVGVIRTKVVIEGTFRMGLPHGVITGLTTHAIPTCILFLG